MAFRSAVASKGGITAEQAQAACAAAITVASLPTAAQTATAVNAALAAAFAAVPAAVAAAVPDTGDIESAIATKFPDLTKLVVSLGFSDDQDLVAAVPGQVIEVWGYHVRVASSNDGLAFYSLATLVHSVATAGDDKTYEPHFEGPLFKTATGEKLRVTCSGDGEGVGLTIFYRVANP